MTEYFCKVPIALYRRARDLVRLVNVGSEVFLLDVSVSGPTSFIINPSKPKGGARLRVGDTVLVTNQSQLWLVKIERTKNGYLARRESNYPAAPSSSDIVAPVQDGINPYLLRKARRSFLSGLQRKILEGSTLHV